MLANIKQVNAMKSLKKIAKAKTEKNSKGNWAPDLTQAFSVVCILAIGGVHAHVDAICVHMCSRRV